MCALHQMPVCHSNTCLNLMSCVAFTVSNVNMCVEISRLCMNTYAFQNAIPLGWTRWLVLEMHNSFPCTTFRAPELQKPTYSEGLYMDNGRYRRRWGKRIVLYLLREPGERSRYSDWLRAGRRRGRSSSPRRVKNFLFSTSSRPGLGPTQPPLQWLPGGSLPGGKAAGVWGWPLTSN
jgi:hypothetical protein